MGVAQVALPPLLLKHQARQWRHHKPAVNSAEQRGGVGADATAAAESSLLNAWPATLPPSHPPLQRPRPAEERVDGQHAPPAQVAPRQPAAGHMDNTNWLRVQAGIDSS